MRTARLATAPGTRWTYCNVAARLVEVADGQPFPEYLRNRVFAPLGTKGNAVHGRDVRPADGRHSFFGLWIARPEPSGFLDGSGSGGVITNAHDMGRWLIAQGGHAPRTLTPTALTWSQLTYFAAPLTTALATAALAALITLTVRIWALTNALK